MIKLDLSQFKHIKSDGKTTTLQHLKGGHELKIMHKALSPDSQKQLQALANVSKQYQTPEDSTEAREQKMADGGGVNYRQAQMVQGMTGSQLNRPTQDHQSNVTDQAWPLPSQTSVGRAVAAQQQPQTDSIYAPTEPPSAEMASSPPDGDDDTRKAQGGRIGYDMGGNVSMPMAKGGNIQPDIASKQQTQAAKQSMPSLDPSIKAKKDLYNFLLSSGGPASTPADMFGPNGETPKNPVNPQLWAQVENSPHLSQLTAQQIQDRKQITRSGPAMQQQAEHDAALPQNVVNAKIGKPLVPDPGSPTLQEQPERPAAKKEMGMAYGGKAHYADSDGPVDASDATGDAAAKQQAAPPVQSQDMPTPQGAQPGHPPGLLEHLGNIVGRYGAKAVQDALIPVKAIGQGAIDLSKGVYQGAGLDKDEGEPEIPSAPAQQAPVPTGGTQAIAAEEPANQPQPQPDVMDQSMGNAQRQLEQGYQTQIAGLKGAAQVEQQVEPLAAAAQAQNVQSEADANTLFQNTYDDLNKERQAHVADIQNGHIDPDKYWDNHSRILSMLGMLIAGFNPAGRPGNTAVDMLKYQMDKSIDAQKTNLNSDQNLLAANLRQFGNARDATDMTKIMLQDVLQSKLAEVAATAKSQNAVNAANIAIGPLQREQAATMRDFAFRRAMTGLASNPSGDPNRDTAAAGKMANYAMASGNSELARELQSRIVNGVGVSATGPVPDDVRKQVISAKSANDLMNMSLAFSQKPMPTNPAEFIKYRNQAATIQQQLIASIKQAQHDGVYKPAEAEFLLSQIGGSPGSIFANLSSVPKIQQIQAAKQNDYNNLLQTYGIKPQRLPQQPAAPQQEQPQIKTVNGIRYMRGPNGEPIRLKP